MTPTEIPKHETVLHTRDAQIAKVYAASLLRAAVRQNKAELMLEQLHTLVHDLFAAQPLLEKFLSSRAIRHDRKEHLIRSALGEGADPMFLDFLLVLNRHDRLDLLRAIWLNFRNLQDERAHRIRVKVRSAVPLTETQQQQLKKELQDDFGLEPVLEMQTDERLLGGMIVQVGDWLYDGSVQSKLDRARKQLLSRSNYVIQSWRDRFSPD
ncbi:MAG TPA: ATP synthase F1 subunit delta [Gemmataceae bacterium]|jgi:F-type H+-transporting ATPase subunit delta|nr:ATP synthase F1 subunit delta [Gemmataceae bacterium]